MKTLEVALSLALCASIALGVGACASASAPDEARDTSAADAADGVHGRARALLDEARAAKERGDHAEARARSAEAIDDLLSVDVRRDEEGRIATLTDLGRLAKDTGDLGAAERARRRVLEFWTRTLPEDHPDLQRARTNLAVTLFSLGDLEGARALQERVLEVRTRTLPGDHPDLQSARGNLAGTIRSLGDLQRARSLEEQVLEVRSRTLPEDHTDLQAARQNLALTLSALGDLQGARALLEQALEVWTRTLPGDHPNLQATRLNLASTIYVLGDLQGARVLQEQALEVWTRTLPEDGLDVARARASLAETIGALGDPESARALQERALEVFARTLPADHPDLERARLGLASTISRLGDPQGARVLQEMALEAYSRTRPEDHLDLQAAREALAVSILELGDLLGARALQEQALEVHSRALPEDHPSLARTRGNLAQTLCALRDFEGARELQEQVVESYARRLPEDHPDLAWARGNLATTIAELGDHEEARVVLEEVLEVQTRTLPEDHPELQATRGALARTLGSLGDQEGARALFEQVLEVYSRKLPEDHPDLAWAQWRLAVAIAAECAEGAGGEGENGNRARESCSSLVRSIAQSSARMAHVATLSSSTREAEERCTRLGHALSTSLSFAAGAGIFEPDPLLARDAFVLSETTRAGALTSARFASLARSDERCGELRKEIREAGEQLALFVQSGATRDAYDATAARRDRAQRELVQLASRSTDAAGFMAETDPTALSQRLSESDAIVAYRRYSRWEIPREATRDRTTDSLCAFVLRKGSAPELHDLGAIGPIEAAVKEWREVIDTPIERGVAASADLPARIREKGEALRRLVFDPLLPALGRTQRLIVALDDVMHCVPLDALPSQAEPENDSHTLGELLGDRYRIEEQLSLTEIGTPSRSTSRAATLVALGGASFNSEPLPVSAEESTALDGKSPGSVPRPRGGAWDRGFEPLTHTGPEARAVAELFEETADEAPRSIVLEKRRASREAVNELAPKARFLHVATHGWFAPESVRSWSDPQPVDGQGKAPARTSAEERVRGSSPMLLCGLALAGANLPPDPVGRYPGLVTAEEISGWDLSNCEMAVLSACDTNVGERRAGQGVASLQKALHMAGARTAITSRWRVPDEATKILMLDFYRRIWVEKKPKSEALWEAKRSLREAKDEGGRPLYTTRDWAAWVLTGEPR